MGRKKKEITELTIVESTVQTTVEPVVANVSEEIVVEKKKRGRKKKEVVETSIVSTDSKPVLVKSETLVELESTYKGRGPMKGFIFNQLKFSGSCYLYEVADSATNIKHYEVFKRVINTQFNCVSKPGSNAFGLWAWCVKEYDTAVLRYEELNEKLLNESKI